jgi:hypothetical protein
MPSEQAHEKAISHTPNPNLSLISGSREIERKAKMRTIRAIANAMLVTSFVIGYAPTGLSAQGTATYSQEKNRNGNDQFAIHARIAPDNQFEFDIPAGKMLVITDIVVQNRASGDAPVSPSQFSRLFLNLVVFGSSPGKAETLSLTVVGNDTLNLHFTTGLRTEGFTGAESLRQIFSGVNSTAPFFEILISGFLTKTQRHDG